MVMTNDEPQWHMSDPINDYDNDVVDDVFVHQDDDDRDVVDDVLVDFDVDDDDDVNDDDDAMYDVLDIDTLVLENI